jgi:hypothetical protein
MADSTNRRGCQSLRVEPEAPDVAEWWSVASVWGFGGGRWTVDTHRIWRTKGRRDAGFIYLFLLVVELCFCLFMNL